MTTKPRLLDLFCGAGGAAKGLQRAGFQVVGVDNRPQPHYCGDEFYLADALTFPLEGYDAYWASPPCQLFTRAGQQWRKLGREYPDLIGPTRGRLQSTGRMYIIENVPGAPLMNPTTLTGAMFGLRVRRRRIFESNFPLPLLLIPKEEPSRFRTGRPVKEGDIITPVGHFSGADYARRQMGIDWMTKQELTQAIPPAYSEYLGRFMMNAVFLSWQHAHDYKSDNAFSQFLTPKYSTNHKDDHENNESSLG